jgi:hypothetical protein
MRPSRWAFLSLFFLQCAVAQGSFVVASGSRHFGPEVGETQDAWDANTPASLPLVPGGAGWGMVENYGASGRDSISGGSGAAYTIRYVTNLNPTGSGSLKAALQNTGRRYIVFNVCGVIDGSAETTANRRVTINDGAFEVLGFTAPCAIATYGMHFRPGGVGGRFSHIGMYQAVYSDSGEADTNGDVMQISGGTERTRMLFDNVYITGGTDENADNYEASTYVTWYQSIIAEALYNSNHPETPHSMGMLIGRTSTNVDVIRSIFAHNNQRNPLTRGPLVSLLNNIVFNPGTLGVELQNESGVVTATNIEGNLFLDGPDTTVTAPISQNAASFPLEASSSYYVAGNRALGWAGDATQAALIRNEGAQSVGTRRTSAYPAGYTVTAVTDIADFAALVASTAGPYPSAPLAAHQAILDNITARITGTGDQGGFIDSPRVPSISGTTVDHSAGADPIPDTTAGRVIQASGYTLMEEWIERRRQEKM